jgi:hypothetical protein
MVTPQSRSIRAGFTVFRSFFWNLPRQGRIITGKQPVTSNSTETLHGHSNRTNSLPGMCIAIRPFLFATPYTTLPHQGLTIVSIRCPPTHEVAIPTSGPALMSPNIGTTPDEWC